MKLFLYKFICMQNEFQIEKITSNGGLYRTNYKDLVVLFFHHLINSNCIKDLKVVELVFS